MDDRDWATLAFSLFLEDSTTDVAIGMNEKQGLICDDPTDAPTDSPGYVVIDFLGESAQLQSDATLFALSVSLNDMARAAGLASPDAGSTDPILSVTASGIQTTVCGTGSSEEVRGSSRFLRGGLQVFRSRVGGKQKHMNRLRM